MVSYSFLAVKSHGDVCCQSVGKMSEDFKSEPFVKFIARDRQLRIRFVPAQLD